MPFTTLNFAAICPSGTPQSRLPLHPPMPQRTNYVLVLRVALAFALLCPAAWAPAAERSGQTIYAEMCAKCHGKTGEGSDEEYPERLQGELSVGELAKLIDKTMPYQHPEKI